MEEAVGTQPVAHGVGEAGQLDAVGAHDADAAKLEPFRESRIVRPSSSAAKASSAERFGGLGLRARCATHAGETLRPTMRSPASVWSR